jgi:hypothetical protein
MASSEAPFARRGTLVPGSDTQAAHRVHRKYQT